VPRSADGQCYSGVSRDGLARSERFPVYASIRAPLRNGALKGQWNTWRARGNDADLLFGRMAFAGYPADVVYEPLFGFLQHLPDNTFDCLKFENLHIEPARAFPALQQSSSLRCGIESGTCKLTRTFPTIEAPRPSGRPSMGGNK